VISFVVPAHNEEAFIGRTLSAMNDAARALGEPYEIIVASDASTDRTGDIALAHCARLVVVNHRQISATRNAGARAATGELFFFVDADTMVTERAVRAAVRALRGGAVGGGTSGIRFADGPMPFYATVMERLMPPIFHAIRMAPGCFLICTRKAYLTAGGFDETLFATEEVVFAGRLKRQGKFVMLREPVFTSGRKLRAHSALDLARIAVRLALGGRQALQRRDGMEYWYEQRKTLLTDAVHYSMVRNPPH
jgi:glycosyltransferase involved in cell wall biosynthesis